MERSWSGENEFREIVQLAAIRVTRQEKGLQEVESLNILCKPVKNPKLCEYFTNLTGISQPKLEQEGCSFLAALERFQNFLKTKRSVYCWGQGDELAFRESCFLQGIKDDGAKGIEFLDVRTLFTKLGYNVRGYQSGTIHNQFGVQVEGQPHDALFDVRSIVASLSFCLESIDG